MSTVRDHTVYSRAERAIRKALESNCDFVLFNDRLIPTKDQEWVQMDCPVVLKSFLLRKNERHL